MPDRVDTELLIGIGKFGDGCVDYIIDKDDESIISGFCDTTGDTNM